jgi:hypothetical protein
VSELFAPELFLDDETQADEAEADRAEVNAIARYSNPLGPEARAHLIAATEGHYEVAVTGEDRAARDAARAELIARFAVWDAPLDSLLGAQAAHDQAVAAWLEADQIAKTYSEWLRDQDRGVDVCADRTSRAEIARAVALADAYDNPEYRVAQARIEVGRRRSKDEGARLYLAERGGFGLFDPSLVGDLETLSEGADADDMVNGVLGTGELAILFGDSYLGKSFLALDWALSVAHGVPWLGRQAKRGKVLYLAMEGIKTLHKRELAWSAHRHLPAGSANFTAYPRVVNLMHDDSVSSLAEYIERESFDVVVIDTLSMSLSGADENSSAEMGSYVASLLRLKESREGCTVLAIHHSRKDNPEVMRGSGTLFAGVDRVLCWKDAARGGDERKLVTQKDKSGEVSKPIRAKFKQVSPSAVLEESDGDGNPLERMLRTLTVTDGTVMRTEFQRRLVESGIKPSIDSARMAVKRAIDAGQMHEGGGALLPGPA